MKLWKHHAAQSHAERINVTAAARGESWLPRYGGRISSEWEFAKGLQLLEEDPEIYAATERWIEAADWIVWQLCGKETRNVCTAGYKGIYQDGGWPSSDFLAALNPGFAGFAHDKLEFPLSPLGGRAGSLTAQAAAWTGLPEGIAVAVGNVDAHVTAPAAKATLPGQMLAVMGTSTCHVMNGDRLAEVPGMCGVVENGIVQGLWGYEAGQSGVGDIFAWFVDNSLPAEYLARAAALGMDAHDYLSSIVRQATGGRARSGRTRLGERQPVGAGRPLAVGSHRRPHAVDQTRGHLPGTRRGHRVWHSQDHRNVRGGRRALRGVRRRRRTCSRMRS